MGILSVGISGRLEEGETLTAVSTATGTSFQWQAFVGGQWVNVGTVGSATYLVPKNAAGTAYRVIGTQGGETATSLQTAAATVDGRNGVAPALSGSAFSVNAIEQTDSIGLFSPLTFSDGDKGNYTAGALQVTSTHAADTADLLSIRFQGTGAGQFSYNAATREVLYAFTTGTGTVVGQIDAALNGAGGQIKVSFNANATKTVVDALINNLVFTNTDDSPEAQRILTLRVTDPTGASAQRAVVVNVQGTADAPVFTNGTSFALDENTAHVGVITAMDPDEAGAIVYSLVTGIGSDDNTLFSIDGATGALSFLAPPDREDAGHVPSYQVRVRAADAGGQSSEQVLTINVNNVNEAPQAVAFSGTVNEDGPSVTFTALFSDVDAGDSHAVTLDTSGVLGTVTQNGNSFTYDAAGRLDFLRAGDTATETFTYTVTDAGGLADTRSVSVTVTGANDAATIQDTAPIPWVTEDGSVQDGQLTTGGTLWIVDPDQGEAAFVADDDLPLIAMPDIPAVATFGRFGIDAAGNWTYSVDNAEVQQLAWGETKVVYAQVHSVDGTATGYLCAHVYGMNDPFQTVDAAGTVVEAGVDPGIPVASGQLQVVDVDAKDKHTWTGGAAGTYGTFAVTAGGAWTYTLNNNAPATQALVEGQSVVETFTVSVRDVVGVFGYTAQQNVTVTIQGGNDAPVIDYARTTGTVYGVEAGKLVIDSNEPEEQVVLVDSAGRTVVQVFEIDPQGYSVPRLARYNADGSLDTSFGGDGSVETPLLYGGTLVEDAAGRLLTVCRNNGSGEPEADWLVRRINPDGSLDASFGVNGVASIDFGAFASTPRALMVDASGAIFVFGDLMPSSIVKLNSDGGVDESFGTGGRWALGSDPIFQDNVMMDAAGRFLFWTPSSQWGNTDTTIARYLQDGTLDTSFGSNGYATLSPVVAGASVDNVMLAPDDRIMVLSSTGDAVYVTRFTSDGVVDTSFGDAGTATLAMTSWGVRMAVASDGSVLLGAVSTNWPDRDFEIVRLTADGALDETFGGGLVTTDFRGGDDILFSLHAMADGGVLASGLGDGAVLIARYDLDGTLASDFGVTSPDLTVTGGVWAYDIDAGDTVQWSGGTGAGLYGDFAIDAAGVWIYTVDPQRPATAALGEQESATETFTVTATDAYGATDTEEVVVTVVGSFALSQG